MNRSSLLLILSVAAAPAWAEPACLKAGDPVSLSGIVAERRVDRDDDGKRTRVLLLRTAAPVCIAGDDGERRTDKLQLVTSTEPELHVALAAVAGGKIRVNGVLVLGKPGPDDLVPDVVEVKEAFDLESPRGEVFLQPEIPIEVRFRKAFLSSGMVAQFKNETGRSLAVTVEFYRESTDRSSNQDLVLNGGQTREIGEREGWAFVKGDKITLSRKGFKTSWIIVPEL